MRYKHVVSQILALPWETLSKEQLGGLMILSYCAAAEFAASLRVALRVHKNHQGLMEMARGELITDNMVFRDYRNIGDHSQFLDHFVAQLNPKPSGDFEWAGRAYINEMQAWNEVGRAMSVFSREKELPGIFERILTNSHWEGPALEAFQFYLKRHIELDSMEGGHGDLIGDLELDNDQLESFYRKRLRLYKPLFPELLQG